MYSIPETTAALLLRHPAPALPLEEVQSLLARERIPCAPAREQLALELQRRPDLIRVLEGPRRRWAGGAPRPWILALHPGRADPPGSMKARMRESLRRLGEEVDTGSAMALARWERLVREEGRVRDALTRRRQEAAGTS